MLPSNFFPVTKGVQIFSSLPDIGAWSFVTYSKCDLFVITITWHYFDIAVCMFHFIYKFLIAQFASDELMGM